MSPPIFVSWDLARRKKYRKYLRYILQSAKKSEKNSPPPVWSFRIARVYWRTFIYVARWLLEGSSRRSGSQVLGWFSNCRICWAFLDIWLLQHFEIDDPDSKSHPTNVKCHKRCKSLNLGFQRKIQPLRKGDRKESLKQIKQTVKVSIVSFNLRYWRPISIGLSLIGFRLVN